MGKWSAIGLAESVAFPRLCGSKPLVHFLQTIDQLGLLLFEHLDVAFGVDLIVGLLALANIDQQQTRLDDVVSLPKNADCIVSFTSGAWIGSITFALLQTTSITGFADAFSDAIGSRILRRSPLRLCHLVHR